MSTGVYLQLYIGEKKPELASKELINALQSVEVILSEEGKNGFELVFVVGQNKSTDRLTFKELEKVLKPLDRVVISVIFGVVPKVLIDGIVILQQFKPNVDPGKSTVTIIGEGLESMMDLVHTTNVYEASDSNIVEEIINQYSNYDITAKVVKPENERTLSKDEKLSARSGLTDLEYLQTLAGLYTDYVFYIETVSVGNNIAYWGPSERAGVQPQKPLLFNMGEYTNVKSINFTSDALKGGEVEGNVQDAKTGETKEIPKEGSSKDAKKGEFGSSSRVKKYKLNVEETSGKTIDEVMGLARKKANEEEKVKIQISGELDTLRYGDILRVRQAIELRGVGEGFNNEYYVKKIQHTIRRGSYKQNFTLRGKTEK